MLEKLKCFQKKRDKSPNLQSIYIAYHYNPQFHYNYHYNLCHHEDEEVPKSSEKEPELENFVELTSSPEVDDEPKLISLNSDFLMGLGLKASCWRRILFSFPKSACA